MPEQDYFGSDSFSYTVFDSGGQVSNAALVNIVVDAVNDAPSANDDMSSVDEDTSATILPLANDTDVDGDPLSSVLDSGA